MNIKPHQFLGQFESQHAHSPMLEARVCRKADAPQVPGEYQRERYVDRRVTRERQNSQGTVHHLIDNSRYNIGSFFNTFFGGRERKEGTMQAAERDTEEDTYRAAGEIRWRLANTDPMAFKQEAKEKMEGQTVKFVVDASSIHYIPGTTTLKPEKYEFQVLFNSNKYWSTTKNETQIASDIQGKSKAQLNALYGITLSPVGHTVDFFNLTAEQAKQVAKLLMVRYVRGRLETGMVSEVNIREAQLMLFDHPEYISVLEGTNKEEKKEKARSKKALSGMIDQLKGMTGKTFGENYSAAETEHNYIKEDLKFFPRGLSTTTPPLPVNFQSSFLQQYATGWHDQPALGTTRPNVKKDAMDKARELNEAIKYYRGVADHLQRIHRQIQSMKDMHQPTNNDYAKLFDAAGNIQKGQFDKDTNPGLIGDILSRELKELDEESHDHGHEKEAPVGARAVIEIYKKYFIEIREMSDDAAEMAAQEKFLGNEPLQQEYEHLDEVIEEKTGGKMTFTNGIANGVIAAAKGLALGSNEQFICQIAEHENIQVPRGVGNAATSKGTKILEAGTWAGTAALTAAGIAAGFGAAPIAVPVGAAAAALATGAYGAMKMVSFAADHIPRSGPVGAFFHKILCVDRLFGTRQLAFLWPRWGARPAWGSIAHRPRKLEVVWDAMLKGIKEKKLDPKSWYVKSQLKEVGRLLLQNKWIDMADTVAQTDMSAEEKKKYSMANKRAELQRQINEMVQEGAAFVGGVENKTVSARAQKTMEDAAGRTGAWRRGTGNYIFGGGFGKWLSSKS